MLASWWFWMVAGFVLGMVEIAVPGFIFLGFAIGAAVTGLVMLIGQTFFAFGLPAILLIFAVASVVAWLALRAGFGTGGRQPKLWDRDINDG